MHAAISMLQRRATGLIANQNNLSVFKDLCSVNECRLLFRPASNGFGQDIFGKCQLGRSSEVGKIYFFYPTRTTTNSYFRWVIECQNVRYAAMSAPKRA